MASDPTEMQRDGIHVELFTGEDGAPVVQIDTPMDTDDDERVRVWVNDALVVGGNWNG